MTGVWPNTFGPPIVYSERSCTYEIASVKIRKLYELLPKYTLKRDKKKERYTSMWPSLASWTYADIVASCNQKHSERRVLRLRLRLIFVCLAEWNSRRA
jgi:hypothetical protein